MSPEKLAAGFISPTNRTSAEVQRGQAKFPVEVPPAPWARPPPPILWPERSHVDPFGCILHGKFIYVYTNNIYYLFISIHYIPPRRLYSRCTHVPLFPIASPIPASLHLGGTISCQAHFVRRLPGAVDVPTPYTVLVVNSAQKQRDEGVPWVSQANETELIFHPNLIHAPTADS